jgi:hypothetical protein
MSSAPPAARDHEELSYGEGVPEGFGAGGFAEDEDREPST